MRTPMEKNLQPIPRTLSEANRDAQYCSAIQTFRSDAKLTWDFVCNATLGFLWVAVVAGAIGGVVYLAIN